MKITNFLIRRKLKCMFFNQQIEISIHFDIYFPFLIIVKQFDNY